MPKLFEVTVSFTMPVLAKDNDDASRVAREHVQEAMRDIEDFYYDYDVMPIEYESELPSDFRGCLAYSDDNTQETVEKFIKPGESPKHKALREKLERYQASKKSS